MKLENLECAKREFIITLIILVELYYIVYHAGIMEITTTIKIMRNKQGDREENNEWSDLHKKYQESAARSQPRHSYYKDDTYLTTRCDNILNNITRGKWVRKVTMFRYQNQVENWKLKEKNLERELQDYWVKRGIPTKMWRDDGLCGHKNHASKPPNSTWPAVASWCDADGEKPCCSNIEDGACAKPTEESCNCSKCIDSRKYVHADASEWIAHDPACHWKNYSAEEACEVIERSPFSELHFVGDSFMRNMFRAFVMLITSDALHGAVNESTPANQIQLCTENQQFFWKECRRTLHDMSKTMHTQNLCGGRGWANFSATMEPYYGVKFKDNFLSLVKKNLGKSGSLLFLSIGFHMGCRASKELLNFVIPAVEAIDDYYGSPAKPMNSTELSGRWPQIILSLPLTIGLLKPPKFLSTQNELKCAKYSFQMMAYAKRHDIRVLDFRPLTTLVHSFDGTHHGMAINLMKNQIWLNFVASLNAKKMNK